MLLPRWFRYRSYTCQSHRQLPCTSVPGNALPLVTAVCSAPSCHSRLSPSVIPSEKSPLTTQTQVATSALPRHPILIVCLAPILACVYFPAPLSSASIHKERDLILLARCFHGTWNLPMMPGSVPGIWWVLTTYLLR